ncbi:MAG TPA: tetratricopeptide repeat protein [Pyrinomonadaceae bacterium]|nr:tetratricopeptide repeat protein [Pyrinomonadaceae bacterium]
MSTNAMLRGAVWSLAAICLSLCLVSIVRAQDPGSDVGGGAGIFRPRNPETKKATKPPTTGTKPTTGRTTGTTRPRPSAVAERVEELLDKGNDARDTKKYLDAENAYKEVLKLKPRDARAAYGLGNVYSDQQRWDDAESAYRNSVTWAPNNADAYVALSVVLVQPSPGADNAKRFADAESFARRSVQLDPKNAVGWDRLGVALQARGLTNSETEHSYRRAIELDPQFAAAYAHLARMLNRANRASEATPFYEKAIELAKDPATLNLIADSLQGEQLWQNSEPVIKRALELDANNPTSLLLMGRLLVVYRRYQEAEPYLKSATEVSSRAFQPFNLLGRAYLGMDRYSDAEATYERASAFAGAGEKKQLAGMFGFEGVGDGYLKSNQKDKAIRAYQRALELDPNNNGAAQKLARARAN